MSDCSPANRERELGLDRRETGLFYPIHELDAATVIAGSTPGVAAIRNAFAGPDTQFLILHTGWHCPGFKTCR